MERVTICENRCGAPLLDMEENRRVHTLLEVGLDEDIDESILEQAVSKVCEVYTPTAYQTEKQDGKVIFVKNEDRQPVHHSKDKINPLSDKNNHRMFSINFYKDKFTVIVNHSITDGKGLFELTKSIIYFYYAIKENKTVNGIQSCTIRKENDAIDFWNNYYETDNKEDTTVYLRQGDYLPQCNDSKDLLSYAKLVVDKDDFLRFAKEKNATVATAMLYLMSSVILKENVKDLEKVMCMVTVDGRKALNLEDTFLNCSLAAYMYMDRNIMEDCEKAGLGELRKQLKEQIKDDYLRNFTNEMIKSGGFAPVIPTYMLTYMGKIEIDGYEKHVKDVIMYEETYPKLNAYEINGKFYFVLHFNQNNRKYCESMKRLFNQNGIQIYETDFTYFDAEEN